jgi:hypothetical protein
MPGAISPANDNIRLRPNATGDPTLLADAVARPYAGANVVIRATRRRRLRRR